MRSKGASFFPNHYVAPFLAMPMEIFFQTVGNFINQRKKKIFAVVQCAKMTRKLSSAFLVHREGQIVVTFAAKVIG